MVGQDDANTAPLIHLPLLSIFVKNTFQNQVVICSRIVTSLLYASYVAQFYSFR